MKTNKPHNFLLLALTAVFSCCSGEDYSDITVSGTPSGETSTAPLTITVTDGGYASLSGGSSTRAFEVDYSTVFTEGDKIGVFAVKDNAIVKEVSNLCLTASPSTDTNAALTWKSASNETPASINGATYYAYYPYKSDLKIGDLAPTAATAADFFASVITNWTPAKHQSTYADYTAQDLMIAQGTADGKSLSFSMSHQMALVVIDLPRNIKYSLSSDANTWTVIGDAPDTKFDDYTPYRMDNGMYRYLVKPSKEKFLISGSYANKDNKTTWVYDTQRIGTGNYKIIKVDGGSSATIDATYKPAVGDFYMKDGSVLAGSTALTPEQQAACIGIVFKAGMDENDKLSYYGDKLKSVHGYVVALRDVIEETCEWGQRAINTPLDNITSADNKDYNGYQNTKTIIDGYNNTASWDYYKAFHHLIDYRTTVKAPEQTSDWYLPSLKQLADVYDVYQNKEGNILYDKLKSISDDCLFREAPLSNIYGSVWDRGGYWTSTECHDSDVWYVQFTNNGRRAHYSKEQDYIQNSYLRTILTF